MKKNKAKRSILYLVIVMSCMISFVYFNRSIRAVTNVKSQKGDITFESIDKAATKKRTWRLRGFVIRLDKCVNYNSLSGGTSKYVTIMFDDKKVIHDWEPLPDNEEYIHTYYKITEDVFLSKLRAEGKTKLYKEFLLTMGREILPDGSLKGGIIYINGIFGVYDGGVARPGEYYTLNGIRSVGWTEETNRDFLQYFNIPVTYKPKTIPDMPVSIELQTSNRELIDSKDLENVKFGQDASYTFPEAYTFKGKEYKLYRSYYLNMSKPKDMCGKLKVGVKGADINSVKKRKIKVEDVRGVKIVAMYKQKTPPPPSTLIQPDQLEEDYEEPTPEGEIRADYRDAEQFDVSLGIPTTENVYTNVVSENYLYGYYFNKNVQELSYTVAATKTYYLSWTEQEEAGKDNKTGKTLYKDVPKKESVTKTDTVTIKRWAAYWSIDDLKVYALDFSTIENYALQEEVKMDAANVNSPIVLCNVSKDQDDHFLDPQGYSETMLLASSSLSGSDTKPSIPSNDIQECVESIVGEVKVKNDQLVFNGQIIMDDKETLREGPKPTRIPESPRCTKDDMYKNGITIPRDKANGEYESKGLVSYKKVYDLNSSAINDEYNVDINSVTVHTPTICDAKITDLRAYNQRVNPDTEKASLILDKTFSIYLPTVGDHNSYPGYSYRDYSKYIERREVQFPFDVYEGSTYIAAGNWISINADEETYYLPTWVKEDNYEIKFRARTINCDANNGLEQTELLANYILEDYVAIDTIDVNVSGRLYDLQIYDITDYPTWQSVFRNTNSLTLTGNTYKVGIKNQNGLLTGRLSKYTFPLVNGCHPTKPSIGTVKLGYATRFKLTTIGDMYRKEDYIRIKPRFFYVDKSGQNRREVDLYYTETFDGRRNYLVKVGSDRDKINQKSYTLGSKYWQVPEQDIKATAYVEGITDQEVRKQKTNLFCFDEITLPYNFRTYTDAKKYIPDKKIPNGVDSKVVVRSVQNWYGEYYLPSKVHVVPKGFDLSYYSINKGIDFKEDFWLKNGYIIVNFDITTHQEANTIGHLSYINKENALNGYCNMWNMEGSQSTKVDIDGNRYTFKYGDYIMYDTDKSAAQDYIVGGTH